MKTAVYKVGPVLDASSSKSEQQAILDLLDGGHSVVLDLSSCGYVSSAGLRVMLYAYKVAASRQLTLYLVGVSPEVREVMSITGFEHFFEFFETLDEVKKHGLCSE